MATTAQTSNVVDQLAGDVEELFTAANYANSKGDKVEPAIRVNATGCGWGSVPAKAVALILKHPDKARRALEQSVLDLKDQTKVQTLLAAKRAKNAAKAGGKTQADDTSLDNMMEQLG